MTDALIPRAGVDEIVGYRNAAVDCYARFFRALDEAYDLLIKAGQHEQAALGGVDVHRPWSDKYRHELEAFHVMVTRPDTSNALSTAKRLLDIRVWGSLIERTGLSVLMDKTAKDELRKQMEFVPERVAKDRGHLVTQEELSKGLPEVTVENVLATLRGFQEDADTIFKRGIATAFSKLDARFKSHDGFKVGARMILTSIFSSWGSLNYERGEFLTDIERTFLVLDGKPPTFAYAGITARIESERSEFRRHSMAGFQSEHEGDYFRIRCYKNGNAHLWFTRDDLVEKVNQLLADYYGAALGYGKDSEGDPEAVFAGAVDRPAARNFGLFPTPDKLADKVIEAAKLYSSERRLTVLEPSAGTGQLARRALASETPHGCSVTCIEIQPHLARQLHGHGYARVLCADFLAMETAPQFDRVVMNPPFDRGRDIDHVNHALGYLKPGGILVSIMSASARYSTSAKAEAFRAKVARGRHRWTDLPPDSFIEAGTHVNTCMLVVGSDSWSGY